MLISCSAAFDVARLIADDLERDAGRQSPPATSSRFALTASITSIVFAPGLPPDLEHDGRHAVQARERALLLGAVLGAADVADADRRAVDGLDDEIVERLGIGDAPGRAQHLLGVAGGDVAARRVLVLARERRLDLGDRQLVGGEPIGVHPDVDRALEAADDLHLADARSIARAAA